MRMTVTDTGVGLGQIFAPVPREYTSLGAVVAALLAVSTTALQVFVRGLDSTGSSLAALGSAARIKVSIIPDLSIAFTPGSCDNDQIIDSTLNARTTYTWLDGNTVDLNDGEPISLRGLIDKVVANSHGGTLSDVQTIILDQSANQKMYLCDAGSTEKLAAALDGTETLVVDMSATADQIWE